MISCGLVGPRHDDELRHCARQAADHLGLPLQSRMHAGDYPSTDILAAGGILKVRGHGKVRKLVFELMAGGWCVGGMFCTTRNVP